MPFSFSVLVFQSVSVDLLGVHEGLVKSGDPWDFPGGSVVKNLPAHAGDTGSVSGPGRSRVPQDN